MKLFKRFSFFFMSFICFFNIFMFNCFASGFEYPSNWDEMKEVEKLAYCYQYGIEHDLSWEDIPRIYPVADTLTYKLTNYVAMKLGFVAKDDFTKPIVQAIWNLSKETKTTPLTSDGEVSSKAVDNFYTVFNNFLQENSPKYRIFDTMDLRTVSALQYATKDQWEKGKAFLDAHPNDMVSMSKENIGGKNTVCFYVVSCADMAFFVEGYAYNSYIYGAFPYDSNWTTFPFTNWGYGTNWEYINKYIWNESENNFTQAESCNFTPTEFVRLFKLGTRNNSVDNYLSPVQFSYKNGKAIMVFDTREYAVQWITGQRDIYTTSKFGNYQSGNTIKITGDTLTNFNNTYNIVNSTVNNHYDNGSGFTDGQIQEIIDAIVEAIGDSGGGSGGGGNDGNGSGGGNGTVSGGDSGGGSGGGLSGFLDGLGKLLDGVLAVVGKLLEYVGKFIDLFSDTIARVVEIIPKAFSVFLEEVFPFMPQEFFTAIELAIVLGIVIMIINAFRK